jgi:hypothetical protein
MKRTLIAVVLSLSALMGLVAAAPSAQAASTGPVWLNFTSDPCIQATGVNAPPVAVKAHISPPGTNAWTPKTAGSWVRVDGAFYYGRSEIDAVVWCKSKWPFPVMQVTMRPQYRYFTGPYSYWINNN